MTGAPVFATGALLAVAVVDDFFVLRCLCTHMLRWTSVAMKSSHTSADRPADAYVAFKKLRTGLPIMSDPSSMEL
jgi:hypothetical protein